MKKIILILTIISAFKLNAQKLETVHSFVRERHEVSWYETQQKLWKVEVDKNNFNGEAWYNYYRATRALAHVFNDEKIDSLQNDAIREKYSKLSSQIAEDAYKAIPNSFEGNLLMSLNNNLELQNIKYLKKAYEINPLDARTYDDLMLHNQYIQNQQEFEKFAIKMFEYNEIPSSILNWGYNILSELDENAILLTAGDNDTYACWIVQSAKQFRKDVQVINSYMIMEDDFRNKLFLNMGIAQLNLICKNAKPEDVQTNQNKIMQHLIDSKKSIYTSNSVIQSYEAKWGENLYLNGLSYKYSSTPIDNTSIIRRNYEKRYLLDHIKQTFAFNIGDKISDEFNSMYLPSMLKLYKSYQESEELFKMKELEEYILLISEKSGQQSEVFEVLKDVKFTPTLLTTLLDVKEIEKNMISISDKISMNKYEVTNGDYSKFLDNLKRSNQIDLYKTVMYDSNVWVNQFSSVMLQNPMVNLYHWHPAYDNYPLINVSYESAMTYCEWLTKQYNLQRNREFTQVIFRLPTEQEWLKAAGSGNEKAITCFPNDQPYIKNKDNDTCYLANYQPITGRYFDDGAFLTGTVYSYKPNASGFFCMFGNVSEMINKKGITKGGAWYNKFDECNFQKQITNTKPDCGVGFRIVMEIIEK